MPEDKSGFHIVLSYGDIFRQSGYRTKVVGELLEYERYGKLQPFLIAFDRDAARLGEMDLGGVQFRAHQRSAVLQYYRDLASLAQRAPIRIVHAHNLYSGALALSARRFYGYKVLVEIHGRIPEEYVILGKGGQLSYWLLKRLEAYVMRGANHIIPISYRLKDYLSAQYQLNPGKLTVIPDCADPSIFRWDPVLRETMRRKLGFEDKFVCVHLGSFFIWYDPELIIKIFQSVRQRVAAAHLLVVTEEVSRTRDFLSRYLAGDLFSVKSAPHAEVPPLLAASDLGFLLLRSTPNIEVSSPAKFSEYLNSGLPVLISPKVGDFSALIENFKTGAIVSDEGDFDLEFVDAVVHNRHDIAVRTMAAGRQLTWDAFRSEWSNIIENLVTSPPS
jgi:glycosyltransferase involved in cell wall biosynthesis